MEAWTNMGINLITVKALKTVVSKLNEDVMALEGNSMMKVSDVVSAFEEELNKFALLGDKE